MDSKLIEYGLIVEEILQEYKDFLDNDKEVQIKLVVDRDRHSYLLVETGWQDGYRIYGVLLHLDIIDGKIWIQHDGTEEGVALELVKAGIPSHHIVLAFKPVEGRKITEFAVS